MTTKRITGVIEREGNLCAIPVPFDPKEVFGKVRAPVVVTLNSHSFRSTISRMGGKTFIPLRKSHREAAGVEGGERVTVEIAADQEERVVEVPEALAERLKAEPALRKVWQALSYTNQRESAESIAGAKRPETRERRLAKVLEMLRAKSS